ncbi:MAG: nickel-binding protein [Chthoniobacterales bacterium]
MPTYMDIHEIPGGITADEVAKAHAHDAAVEGKYGVHYHKYWVNERAGKIFCLCEAPNAEAAMQVHREAHGQVAEKIIQVEPDVADLFLGGSEVNSAGAVLLPGGATDARDPGIRTVLFTDIVESTSLTQTLGDDVAMELLQIHDSVVRDALKALNGREVKHTGDGIMASFVSAAAAVRCAAQIQRGLAQRAGEQSNHPVRVRIGGAAGEPVEHGNDIFGSTVQLAARLCSHAEPEQIVVSSVVADLCIGKGLTFRALGEVSLKGFDQPVHAHSVEWSA